MLSAEGNIPQIDRWDESTRGIFHASANHLALPDAYEFRLLERVGLEGISELSGCFNRPFSLATARKRHVPGVAAEEMVAGGRGRVSDRALGLGVEALYGVAIERSQSICRGSRRCTGWPSSGLNRFVGGRGAVGGGHRAVAIDL
eukprot:1178789-Prorocentrum_minimum.AAC.2